jgi:hypothetical protein
MRHVSLPDELEFGPEMRIPVPETEGDREELRQSLEDEGVFDSLSFSKGGINGRLNMPDDLQWEPDGSVHVTITVDDQIEPIDAWFWLFDFGGTIRRRAWWSTEHDITTRQSWHT